MKENRLIFILLTFITFPFFIYPTNKTTISLPILKSLNTDTVHHSNIVIKLEDITEIKKIIEETKHNSFASLFPMITSCLSLLINILLVIYNRRNILTQIIENKKIIDEELNYKFRMEIRNKVAKFIFNANQLFEELSYAKTEYNGDHLKGDLLTDNYINLTAKKRDQIRVEYYSLLITLNDSTAHKELKESIKQFIDNTCYDINLNNICLDSLSDNLNEIYKLTQSIIYPL